MSKSQGSPTKTIKKALNKSCYRYFNANPLGKFTDDCVIRALSIALDKTWDTVFLELNQLAFEKKIVFGDERVYSRILFDDRLDATQKSQLLFFLPCTEILKERFPKTKRHKQFVIDRFDSLLRMYAQGISCYSEAIEKGAGNKLNNMRLYAYGAYVYLKRTLGIDLFDFETCIRKDISPDNIKEFDSLLQIADRIRQCGLIKLSQSLKNQMLDILEQTDFENASVELKEMIDYCFLPLSANYKRTEVVNKIKGFSLDVEDQYHLKRLKSKNEPAYKKIRIATDFLDKYITVVAELYYYNTKHDAYYDVTDYENLLEKYHSELLDFAKNTEFPWYYEKVFNGRDSFPNEKMFYHIFPHPVYNEGDFETFNACAGLCFMLADDFDFLNKQHDFSFEEQLCELLSVAKSENRINEISDVLSTIIQKNPNAKDGIDTFIRECKNNYPIENYTGQRKLDFVYNDIDFWKM